MIKLPVIRQRSINRPAVDEYNAVVLGA